MPSSILLSDSLIPVTWVWYTVTLQVAVKPPSFVVAVMFAVPSETPLTVPFETVATFSLSDVHVIPFFVASVGVITAFIVAVFPFSTLISLLSRLTPVTGTA